VAIEIEGVAIAPGDIVFGDVDGVLIIPRDAAREAISKALEKVSQESSVRTAIMSGMSTVDTFEKFGVM
jgi:regulator of RNase E activity RraA